MRPALSELYVYITLPGTTTPVVCGHLKAIPAYDGAGGYYHYVYGKRYLARDAAIAVDPFILPLRLESFNTKGRHLFGIFSDAMPDLWGRKVIGRRLQSAAISELDYLYYAGDDRTGALSFSPDYTMVLPAGKPRASRYHLTDMVQVIQRIEQKLPLEPGFDDLVKTGSGMGGTRPKSVVERDDGLWLAKFARTDDMYDKQKAEFAVMCMARDLELDVPPIELCQAGKDSVFLIKRFDRELTEAGGYKKYHFLSACTLFAAHPVDTPIHDSYPRLADLSRRLSTDAAADRKLLFKRMLFNVLVSNTDDHNLNHGFILGKAGWRLSPLYDVVPLPVTQDRKSHGLALGEQGTCSSIDNALSRTGHFGVSKSQAQSYLEEQLEKVKDWERYCKRADMSVHDRTLLQPCFLSEHIGLKQYFPKVYAAWPAGNRQLSKV